MQFLRSPLLLRTDRQTDSVLVAIGDSGVSPVSDEWKFQVRWNALWSSIFLEFHVIVYLITILSTMLMMYSILTLVGPTYVMNYIIVVYRALGVS